MGIHDRDYYRDDVGRGGNSPNRNNGDGKMVTFLVALTVAVYIAQFIFIRQMTPLDWVLQHVPAITKAEAQAVADKIARTHRSVEVSLVEEWLRLDTDKVIRQGQVWRLLTYALCHARTGDHALWHIVFNMLALYSFGKTLEIMYGSREFLFFYLAGVIVAAIAWIGLDLVMGQSRHAIGASGGVEAVFMLFAWHFPRQVIVIFFVLPLQIRWALLLFLAIDLYPVLLELTGKPHETGVAHAAHLGGLAFGFLYAKFGWRLDRFGGMRQRPATAFRPRLRIAPGTTPTATFDSERVDKILAKIGKTGQESLTDEERDYLQQASTWLRNRNLP